jgi:citrate lyase beta subunit
MRPSDALIEEARAALAAYAAAGGCAIRFNGRMLEAPIVRRYARILGAVDLRADAGAESRAGIRECKNA